MAISQEIEFAALDDLLLDPRNPRLGRDNVAKKLLQDKILELMDDWNLEELAHSFMESGFWVQEALLVVKEKVPGRANAGLVVIEGNRRLAALKLLEKAISGKGENKWKSLLDGRKAAPNLFKKIPYLIADSREDIESFLGFRHVTGIAQWHPAEKAEFIAKLIEDRGLSYEEVMRKIGSKTATVRQNYIAFNILKQMENTGDIAVEHVEKKFSVLFLSLRTTGVREYLNINMEADLDDARKPVKRTHLSRLENLARWMFGDDDHPPVLKDSRDMDAFARTLTFKEAVAYLERTEQPRLEIAIQKSGIEEEDLADLVNVASDNVEVALMKAHLHRDSKQLKTAVARLYQSTLQLNSVFSTEKSKKKKSK